MKNVMEEWEYCKWGQERFTWNFVLQHIAMCRSKILLNIWNNYQAILFKKKVSLKNPGNSAKIIQVLCK